MSWPSSRPLGWRVLLIALTFLLLPGCARYVRLDLQTGPCLNPPEQFCNENGTNSRVLDFTVYQLREPVDVASLNWEDMLEKEAALQALAPYLADPDDKVIVRRDYTVQRMERRTEKMKRVWRLKHLLVVTSGRFGDEASIAQTRVRFFRRWQSLCFEYYGVKEPIDERRWITKMLRKKTSQCEFNFKIDPNAPVTEPLPIDEF